MNDLINFVRARLDEEERTATLCVCSERPADCPRHNTPKMAPLLSGGYRLPPAAGWVLVDPARILAEVQAKRSILGLCEEILEHGEWWEHERAEEIIQAAALPHAEHPEYRYEWRP